MYPCGAGAGGTGPTSCGCTDRGDGDAGSYERRRAVTLAEAIVYCLAAHLVGDYSPGSVGDDLPDEPLRDSELSRQLALRDVPSGVSLSDLLYGSLIESSVGVVVTALDEVRSTARPVRVTARDQFRMLLRPVSPSAHHVRRVVCGGTWQQVGGIAAGRVVAGVSEQWAGVDAVCQFVGHTVSASSLPDSPSVPIEYPVVTSGFRPRARPGPAPCRPSRPVHLAPEEGNISVRVSIHKNIVVGSRS